MILAEGLKVPPDQQTCPYRPYVWSILLRAAPHHSTDVYTHLVQKGRSSSYNKIVNDTGRTFKGDADFEQRVSRSMLNRALNSFAWFVGNDQHISPYVQGMNVLMAPFLYACKSEPQAFVLFATLLTKYIPLYVEPTIRGAHVGVRLVDICLKIIDRKLYEYFQSKMLRTEVYALPSVLTLSACTPPLSQVLELWDFLFAYGCHMNVLVVIAQLILIRNQLMSSSNPMTLLRDFPELKTTEVIKLAISFVAKLPSPLYDLLVRHGYDESVIDEI